MKTTRRFEKVTVASIAVSFLWLEWFPHGQAIPLLCVPLSRPRLTPSSRIMNYDCEKRQVVAKVIQKATGNLNRANLLQHCGDIATCKYTNDSHTYEVVLWSPRKHYNSFLNESICLVCQITDFSVAQENSFQFCCLEKNGHKQTFQKEISDTTPKPPQIDLGVLLMASRPPPDNTSQKTLSGIKNAN